MLSMIAGAVIICKMLTGTIEMGVIFPQVKAKNSVNNEVFTFYGVTADSSQKNVLRYQKA